MHERIRNADRCFPMRGQRQRGGGPMNGAPSGDDQSAGAVASFGEELRRLRLQHDMSQASLSRLLHYTKGYLSKVENGRKQPTPDLARRCDEALGAGGALAA